MRYCKLAVCLAALLPCCLIASSAHAVWTWDGGSLDSDSIYVGENWNPDAIPFFNNTNSGSGNIDSAIIFTGNVRTTPLVDTVGSTGHFNSITFDANAAAFTFTGFGPLRLGPTSGGIPRPLVNNSPNTQTFDVEFTASAADFSATVGDIVFNQNFKVATNATGSSAASTRRNQVLAGNVYFNNGFSGFGTDKLPGPNLDGSANFSGTGGFFVALGGTTYITAESDSLDTDHIDFLWNGRVEIVNGVLQVSHPRALGAGAATALDFHGTAYDAMPAFPEMAAPLISGRTTIGTSVADTGRLELASNIDVSERLFITGRSASFASAPAHIRNFSGVNTLSGPIETQNITDARAVVIDAHDDGVDATELLTISGDLTQRRDATGGGSNGLVLRGNGAGVLSGNVLNGATPATMTWDVQKFDAGTWTISSSGNDYTGSTRVSGGTLALDATGAIPKSSVVQIDAGATLDVSAQAGFTLGSTVTQTLKGDGSVLGSVNFAAGSGLAVDYNGGAIDSLAISGALNIANATVDFNSLGGPLPAGAHVIATYGSLTGAAFSSVVDLPAGFSLDYNYQGAKQIALVGTAPTPGDFDSDGDVDSTDFNHGTLGFKARFGVNLTGSDFLAWQRNVVPSAATPNSGAVPEPAAIGLCLLGLIALPAARRRGRK